MTNVDVPYEDLIDLLGRRMSLDECVDRITFMGAGPEGVQGDVMTFDVFPNRPDLYSVEGIARGLRGFLGLEAGLPSYDVAPATVDFVVDRNVAEVRPFALGGIIRGLELEEPLLRSLVELQERLHLTVGRKRRKVAIGIHDLDRVVPPFSYRGVRPHEVRFTPLGKAEEMDLAEILTKHEKGREYAPLVASKPLFPIITDAKGEVLSFPPVINGIRTQLTSDTRNLFLDVTGTDLDAVGGCLAILSTALAERGGRIERVRTKYADRTLETPDLAPRPHALDVRRANALTGLDVTAQQAVDFLRRMRHDATAEGDAVRVLSPAYRLDLLHEVDLAEDLAIAWGYDRYPRALPRRQTIGAPLPANEFGDLVRGLLIGYGYQEVMSLVLASEKDGFETPERVVVQNPLGDELTTLRSSLLPALLGIFRLNKHRELPQRVFETGDVVLRERNVRKVAGAAMHPKASFTEGKSLVLSLLRDVGRSGEVEPVEDSNFIPGRAATLLVDRERVGRFGEIHPRILEAYSLVQPVMAFEMDLDSLGSRRPEGQKVFPASEDGDRAEVAKPGSTRQT
ncbi:MAG TPA: phenylalanine--tRNA ligase subunit beta [Thermoplasmata archaeon]|nr:phenylalanine--tRNA ligase subunit beta [Thermoplasmata archaeon]